MDKEKTENPALLHQMNTQPGSSLVKKLTVFVVIAVLGIGTGYGLAKTGGKAGPVQLSSGSQVAKGTVVGSADKSTFKDSAEGMLKEGGIEGEGQYHLERPGGASQNVYLTSSVVDLSAFMGRKIKVFGETHQAQKAGWLMDVGRVEVLE